MSFSMRMGMGLGAPMQVSGSAATPAIFTINNANNQYMRIRVNTTTTLAVTGTVTIGTSTDPIGTSLEIIASDENYTTVYVKGTGTIVCEDASYITYLHLYNTGTSITGSITGMELTYLYLFGTGKSITGSITGMELTYLYLYNTGTSITGSITGMELTYIYLYKTGTSITGVPPAIGKTLSSIRILGGDSYDYPWTEQTFAPPKRTWTAITMSIDCLSTVGVVEFNTWLLGLASVSNPGTAELTLKNTPTIDELNDAGYGETDTDSGYYAMVTTLGYNLILGT